MVTLSSMTCTICLCWGWTKFIITCPERAFSATSSLVCWSFWIPVSFGQAWSCFEMRLVLWDEALQKSALSAGVPLKSIEENLPNPTPSSKLPICTRVDESSHCTQGMSPQWAFWVGTKGLLGGHYILKTTRQRFQWVGLKCSKTFYLPQI